MAYDRELADRVRELLASEPGLTERPMFGGLAFLVSGNMAAAVSGAAGLMIRVDPARAATLVAEPGVRPVEMRGRQLRGWLRVEPAAVRSAQTLATWIDHGLRTACALPAKPGHRSRR